MAVVRKASLAGLVARGEYRACSGAYRGGSRARTRTAPPAVGPGGVVTKAQQSVPMTAVTGGVPCHAVRSVRGSNPAARQWPISRSV
ncbi:hypothetical protein GCM10020256_03820 [Streptomyces thermocoprophilus]